jgi:hypothetical protein
LGEVSGEAVDGGPAEQLEYGDVPVKALRESDLNPDKEQRTASEVEEIVVDTDVGDSQNFLPHTGDLTFKISDRCSAAADRRVRGGQGTLIDFAVGGSREGRECLDAARDHRGGYPGAEVFV